MPSRTAARATLIGWWNWWQSPTGRLLAVLGPFQIFAGGTSLFALGVMGPAIYADTGWNRALVFSGLTVALLSSAIISPIIGHRIDRIGGKPIMITGTIINALACIAMSAVTNIYAYLAVWIMVGIAMRMFLFDSTFATVVQRVPADQNRVAISTVAIFGGMSATIFWPLGHALITAFGWRATYLIFAALNLFVALPMLLYALRRQPSPPRPSASTRDKPAASSQETPPLLTGRARILALTLFSVVLGASAFMMGALTVHMIGIIEATGIAAALAVTIASLKGAAQAIGRLWEILFASHLSPMTVARISLALAPIAFIILMASGSSVSAALLFTLTIGASHGLITIVRGTLPLVLFGREGYGAVLGLLATPYLLLNALAPLLLAFVIDIWGYGPTTTILLAVAIVAALAMEIMAHWYARYQASPKP